MFERSARCGGAHRPTTGSELQSDFALTEPVQGARTRRGMMNRPLPPVPRPVALTLNLLLTCVWGGGVLFMLCDDLRVVVDPAISVVTADDLIAGAPLPHPRILLSGACLDRDSAASARWTTKNKNGTRSNHVETVALLRRAADGRSTGWLLETDTSTASGCVAEEIQAMRWTIQDSTLNAAREEGLSPDRTQVLSRGWRNRREAAFTVLLGLWLSVSVAAWQWLVVLRPGTQTRVSRRAFKLVSASVLAATACVVLYAAAS